MWPGQDIHFHLFMGPIQPKLGCGLSRRVKYAFIQQYAEYKNVNSHKVKLNVIIKWSEMGVHYNKMVRNGGAS